MASIRSERLELVSLSPEFIDALLAERRGDAEAAATLKLPDDWPDAHDRGFLNFRLRQMRERPEIQKWFVYALVLPEGERPMIGHAGFHGPPGVNAVKAPDAVEVGYSVFDPYRRRGYATEVVRSLIGAVNQKGLTLVPTRLYFKNGRAKLEVALARGKEQRDKRRDIAKRDAERQMERALRARR